MADHHVVLTIDGIDVASIARTLVDELGPERLNDLMLELFALTGVDDEDDPGGDDDLECRDGDDDLAGVDFAAVGQGDCRRLLGWWYGYPDCCVEWFCDVWARQNHLGSEEPPHHPERGHVVCPACRVTPAPLPDRPADRWVLAVPDEDGWLVLNYRAPIRDDGS